MKYVVDPAHSSVGFDVWHAPWSTINGTFSEFAGEFSFSPTGQFSETGSFLNVKVASLDAGKGNLGNSRVISTMEADKFPWMGYTPVGPLSPENAWISGKAYTTRGLVAIRGEKNEVDFRVTFDANGLPGAKVLKLTVVATMDRFAFDICTSWSEWAVGAELTIKATLVANLENAGEEVSLKDCSESTARCGDA